MRIRTLYSLLKLQRNTTRSGKPVPTAVIIVLAVILWPMLKLMHLRHIIRQHRARRILRMRRKEGTRLISSDISFGGDGYPSEADLRQWLSSHLGKPVPHTIPLSVLQACWRNRSIHGCLYFFDRDKVYFCPFGNAGTQECSPFEATRNGGRFAFFTNRSADMFSYLNHDMSAEDLRSNPNIPGMGYTNLWLLEHIETFVPVAQEPEVWPMLATENRESRGNGPWIVFRDPQFDKWRQPNSWRTIVGRFADREPALASARDFCDKYQIRTCVAMLMDDLFWH